MKSDAVYALSKGTSQHSAMPVQATTPPCPHVANVPPKRNNYFFNCPASNLFLIASRHYATRAPPRPGQRREATGKSGTNPDNIFFFLCFVKVFQTQILRKYPRRSCGSFWSSLELRRPTFDRFRPIFLIFVLFF